MMFRHKPFVTLIKKLNNIEQGMGELYRDNFKRSSNFKTFRDNSSFDVGSDPSIVLLDSFVFANTPEGQEFWSNIVDILRKEEEK